MNRWFAWPLLATLAASAGTLIACSDDAPSTATPQNEDASSPGDDDDEDKDDDKDKDVQDASPKADATSKDAGNRTQVEAYCDAVASHGTCPDKPPSVCEEDAKCIYAMLSPEAAASYNECYSAPSCKSDDTCLGEASIKVGGETATKYAEACAAKRTECKAKWDDLCSPIPFVYPGMGEALNACLAKPCAEIDACFDAALKPISDCKKR